MNITAIVACHNRCTQTVRCLQSYFRQSVEAFIHLDAVVIDDGSTDGTAETVLAMFPNARVIAGPGDLYWARAMAIAEREALAKSPDFLLWLNDDVVLDGDALTRLLTTAEERTTECIIAGAVRDPVRGGITYSGLRRRGSHPLEFDRVTPERAPIRVDTFNGNVVLVPRSVAIKIEGIDGAFSHAYADLDYGLRAGRAGVDSLLTPGTVGTCASNEFTHPWLGDGLTIAGRLRFLMGPKGLPPASRARYLMRHGGPIWPVFWIAPYATAAAGIICKHGRLQRTR